MRLLARNAESLFWLARYLERAAGLARVVEMTSAFGGHDRDTGWLWLLALHSDEEGFQKDHEVTSGNIISYYMIDGANPGSIRASINCARENARALRPFIPLEMWVQLNAFHGLIEAINADDIVPSQLPRTCAKIRAGCLAQIGTAEGTLYRDEGYRFFKLGLLIERADQTSRLLDVKFAQGASAAKPADPADDYVVWSTILRAAGAYQVFNRLEHGGVNPEGVARFLIYNRSHPRSIGFCVQKIDETLQILRSSFRLSQACPALEACEVLMIGLHAAAHDAKLANRLHEFNDWVQSSLNGLTNSISGSFFQAHKPTASESAAPEVKPIGAFQKQEQRQS